MLRLRKKLSSSIMVETDPFMKVYRSKTKSIVFAPDAL